MKLLGLDYGEKRIGVAIGDTDSRVALPLMILLSDQHFFERLKQLITEEQIEKIVIGMPRSLGERQISMGAAEAAVRAFIGELEKNVVIPITTEDERFSTDAATRLIGPKGKDRDAVAAAIILQSHLDRVTGN